MRLKGGSNFVESRLHMCLAKPHHKHGTIKENLSWVQLSSQASSLHALILSDETFTLLNCNILLCDYAFTSSYPKLRCSKLRYRKARYCQISNLVARFPALPCTRSNDCVRCAKCTHFCTCCTGRPSPLANAIRFGRKETTLA